MKNLLIILTILFSTVMVNAESIDGVKPLYNKVYRTGRIGDTYHFFLLNGEDKYYHLITNKTDKLTASELKSSNLLQILKKKQSWGKAFPRNGNYTITRGKLYTKLLWNPIKILSSKQIKYLNKTFTIQ